VVASSKEASAAVPTKARESVGLEVPEMFAADGASASAGAVMICEGDAEEAEGAEVPGTTASDLEALHQALKTPVQPAAKSAIKKMAQFRQPINQQLTCGLGTIHVTRAAGNRAYIQIKLACGKKAHPSSGSSHRRV